MPNPPRQIRTLLEIGRQDNGDVPASLISAAYRASRTSEIMLVLRAITPSEVDRLLDPVVARSGHNHRGVVYASPDDSVVFEAAAVASRVYASSPDFRAKLASRGIGFRDVSEAERTLGSAELEPA